MKLLKRIESCPTKKMQFVYIQTLISRISWGKHKCICPDRGICTGVYPHLAKDQSPDQTATIRNDELFQTVHNSAYNNIYILNNIYDKQGSH